MTIITAKFSQSRNDLSWSHWDGADGFIRWSGYDDSFWWTEIATDSERMTQIGPVSGRIYILDPQTDTVTVREPAQ